MKRFATGSLLLAILAVAAIAAHAAPFAMITDLKGAAWAGERKLALLGYLEEPLEIRVEPEARLSVTYFADGVQYSFAGPARVALDAQSARVLEGAAAEARRIVPEKSINGSGLSPEQWRRLQQATVVMRNVKSTFSVIGPDDTKLLDRQTGFEWTPVEGAKSYRLVVYGAGGDVLVETRTEGTHLRPAEPLALEPGRQYRWKVDAIGVSRPVTASGRFTLADDAARERLAGLKRAAGNEPGPRAFYATTLEAEGFSHEARLEWQALARDFPDQALFRERAAPRP
ncbi:MAG TPA: hypothetical protein VF211_14135 [Burkholderiales bacterium]